MEDLLANLTLGFQTALSPTNLLFCFIGVLLGTLVGVLPGIGPTATIAMLLPLTLALSPATSLIMLAGIYYGAQYGGSTTAILINVPGESASAVNRTALPAMVGCRRNAVAVSCEPVTDTTSCPVSDSRSPSGRAHTNCSAPSGIRPDATISRTATSSSV